MNCLERFYRKGVCVIDNAVKTIQKKNGKCGIGNRGKTKIVVKEHFSEKGKTMEEL
ncbi:TPA: tRNA wybutosine-synthesizing protein 3-like protein, partial [Clostridioides difficile]|nr:tRNA wybutosine-synthesizing protein 3-like protein [Clostridioides difficile]